MFETTYTISEGEHRRCEFLDGLRALVRHLERHADILGEHPALKLHLHHEDPVDFLTAEDALGGRRDETSLHYRQAVRDFGGGVQVCVQTWRDELEATPERIAEFIDGAF